MNDFDAERKGTGTMEWADNVFNLCLGCANDCIYCFAAHNATTRFKRREERSDWAREELTKWAEMDTYPKKAGVIMVPSAHDITPFNVDAFCRCARIMLAKGNKLLVVTKPRLACIQTVLKELVGYQDQVLFRFTIGSLHDDVTQFWEPGAPLPVERMAALKLAFLKGWRTSVSIEPMLEGADHTPAIVHAVSPFVTDTVWIGKLNKARLRVDLTIPENLKAVERVERMQTEQEIFKLYHQLVAHPKVRWKDSVQEALARIGVRCMPK